MSHAGPDSALVVAHPDDEVLWFSAVLGEARRVIFCFETIASRPEWTAGRKRVLADYPLDGVESLQLTEAEVFNGADWRQPVISQDGLQVERRSDSLPGFSTSLYRANYEALRRELRTRLRGVARVYTHNPWGEYGHEEHVQVHAAVQSLQQELGFEMRWTNYFSNKSYALMRAALAGLDVSYRAAETNRALADELKSLYQRHGCWTWYPDYVWPVQEHLFQARRIDGAARRHVMPLNFVAVETPGEKQIPQPWTRVLRRLGAYRKAISTIE